jgi:hypothetical protein
VTRNDLRALFGSTQGENVLLWILNEHHVFNRDIKTDTELHLRNWGMKFLSFLGPENTKRSVTGFMQMAMQKDKAEDNK